ncbi:esterase/lipase family protein [Emcibacter sp.]|uniref:esterase/lipase family protein n=1 Tax=Emcibacter sp. TaxID=1979954 RepID=UPI003A91B1C2
MRFQIPEKPANLRLPTSGGKYFWKDLYFYAGWRIQQQIWTGHCRLLDERDARRAWGSYEHCLSQFRHFRVKHDLKFRSKHLVVLLHGLARHKNTMKKPARFLTEKGLDCYLVNYPSTFQSVEDHADQLEQTLNLLEDIETVSFVAHSLGGLVCRELLSRDADWQQRIKIGKLVMIGTPNQGARIARYLDPLWLFRTISGPSGQDVQPGKVARFALPSAPTLVIAGGRARKSGFNPFLQEDNDGVVTVEETKVEGMTRFLLVPSIHTVIMDHPDTLKAIDEFLQAPDGGS